MEPGSEIKEDDDSPETVATVVTPTSTPVEVKEDLEDYSLKTADDFETKIFPVVGEYLRNQGNEEWQIEEWIGRCVNEYKKAPYGKYQEVFAYMTKHVFQGGTPPPALAKYFEIYGPKQPVKKAYSRPVYKNTGFPLDEKKDLESPTPYTSSTGFQGFNFNPVPNSIAEGEKTGESKPPINLFSFRPRRLSLGSGGEAKDAVEGGENKVEVLVQDREDEGEGTAEEDIDEFENYHIPHGATDEAKKLLLDELKYFQTLPEGADFVVTALGDNLFHWQVELAGFDAFTAIGKQLMNYKLAQEENEKNNPPSSYGYSSNYRSRPKYGKFGFSSYKQKSSEPKIVLELKFPNDFPNEAPLFRLISPRFLLSEEIIFNFEDECDKSLMSASGDLANSTDGSDKPQTENTTNNNTNTNSNSTNSTSSYTNSNSINTSNDSSSAGSSSLRNSRTATTTRAAGSGGGFKNSLAKIFRSEKKVPLSMSMQIENRKKWQGLTMNQCFINLRNNLLKETRIEVDLNSQGIPTHSSFWREYKCVPLSSLADSETPAGGKIFLPASALSEMMEGYSHGARYGLGGSFDGRQGPMIFEISTRSGKRSYCGVMEFSAPENCVGVPSWMMLGLGLKVNSKVQIRRVVLPPGNFIQLQPHYNEDIDQSRLNLEWALRRYVALTVGDVIQFEHNHVSYTFNVLACKPSHAISITDLDISVDFADPLYKIDKPQQPGYNESLNLNNCNGNLDINKLAAPNTVAPLTWSFGPLVVSYSSSESEDEEERFLRENRQANALGSMLSQADDSKDLNDLIKYDECPNCRQQIPLTSFWHYDRCKRLLFYCEMCKETYPKNTYDKHMEEFHSPAVCSLCKESMEKRHLATHMTDTCKMRETLCTFCGLKLIHNKKWEHESSCGAMTEVCHKCKVRITRFDLIEHSKVCTGDPTLYKKPSFRDIKAQRKEEEAVSFKCVHCQCPFDHVDDLEVHMLTDHPELLEGEL